VLILTLAVPAFEDSRALHATLESFIESLSPDVANRVEILVSDNNSSDSTFSTAKKLLSGVRNARVIRQRENIGFSGNLCALAKETRTPYIWFIGLGERLISSSLSEITDFLSENSPDWGSVKGYFDFQNVNSTPDLGVKTADCKSVSEIPVINHVISLNIFRTEHVLALKLNRGSPFDDFWPHFEVIAQCTARNPKRIYEWFYFDTSAVLIAKNKHGAWDFKKEALDIFLEWGSVFSRIADNLAASNWIRLKSRSLRTTHLLEFIFMITKFKTLPKIQIIRQVFGDPGVPFHYKAMSAGIAILPSQLLVQVSNLRATFQRIKGPRHT
jgi:glycosyltransferase involved in cell wall biosynthesis